MILTVASYKGGVGKTTTAVHLAAYLNTLAPALLLDGDHTRSSLSWAERGAAHPIFPAEAPVKHPCMHFPFRVAPIDLAAKLAWEFKNIVIDTGQRPNLDDLQAAADGCDLLVVPAVPSALDTDGLGQTVRALQSIPYAKFKVLLTRVAPDAQAQAKELRELLASMKVPVFQAEIPRLKAFEKAADQGVIVDLVDDRNAARAWAAYVAVGKELRSVLDASRGGGL